MQIEPQLIAWGFALLTLFIGSVFGLLKWFFSRYINGIDARISSVEKNLADIATKAEAAIAKEAAERRELEREFRGLLALLPQQYVARDDWIIMVAKMENKIDAVATMLNGAIKDMGRGYR